MDSPRATLRLLCFHHAGGAAHVFREWPARLPKTIEVCPVQLPGHGTRMGEPPLTDRARLVDEAIAGLRGELVGSFAFFGHSLGALVAFLVARELRRRRMPGPKHLFVAARVAPSEPPPAEPLHRLPDREFVERVRRRYNAIPDAVANAPELLALFLPMMRADLGLHETYVHAPEPPLECPITAFGGTRDAIVTKADLEAWGPETSAGFSLRMIEGDHFFVHAKHPPFTSILESALEPLTR